MMSRSGGMSMFMGCIRQSLVDDGIKLGDVWNFHVGWRGACLIGHNPDGWRMFDTNALRECSVGFDGSG